MSVSTPFHPYNKSRMCYVYVTSLLRGAQNNSGTLKKDRKLQSFHWETQGSEPMQGSEALLLVTLLG